MSIIFRNFVYIFNIYKQLRPPFCANTTYILHKVRQKRHTILPCAFRLIFAFGSLSEIRVLRLFVGRNDDLAFAVIADRISRYAFDILTSGMYDASLI